MGKAACVVIGIIVLALIILTIALVASSLEKLSSKEIGIQYDTIQKHLDDKVFSEGLHIGPVGYEFIKFPNVFNTMNFDDISCLNADAVTIGLDLSFQFRVQMTGLKDVVLEFKDFDGFKRVIGNVATASVHEACSYFDTVQLQTARGQFRDRLEEILSERVKPLFCDIEAIQVNNIERPRDYENAVRSKERAREDIRVAEQERPRLLTEANTTRKEAESEAQIILDKADSEARIRSNLANTEAEGILEQYTREAEAYESIMSSSGLKFTPEGFISYLGVRVISNAKNPVYVGLQSPAKSSYVEN